MAFSLTKTAYRSASCSTVTSHVRDKVVYRIICYPVLRCDSITGKATVSIANDGLGQTRPLRYWGLGTPQKLCFIIFPPHEGQCSQIQSYCLPRPGQMSIPGNRPRPLAEHLQSCLRSRLHLLAFQHYNNIPGSAHRVNQGLPWLG